VPPSPWLGLLPGSSARALPSLCAVCHGWGRGRVCAACIQRFAPALPRCARCGPEVPAGSESCGACLLAPPAYASTVAAVTYGYPWDRLVTGLKYRAALDLAAALAELLLNAGRRSPAAAPALLIPVPLHAARLRERGYNQAWELARRLAGRLRCRADAALLLRVRDTPHQLALAPAGRAANVRDAFALEPRRRHELEGRAVTLVDDVMTTGATAAEIARVLLAAGAARVDVWVVARTPRGDENA
jgi:ComF family protein